MRSWNVYISGRRVAVIDASDGQIHALAAWLRAASEPFDIWLAAYEAGTLVT